MSTTRTIRTTRDALLAAALVYELHTDHSGPAPLEAGARLRLAAKAYARAVRESVTAMESVT